MNELDIKNNWGSEKLEAELEIARDGLRGLDRHIRKILGRELPENENSPLQSSTRIGQKRSIQDDRKRNSTEFFNDVVAGGKKRWQMPSNEPKTVFSRLSARVPSTADDSGDDDDNSIKPAVSSRIIATPRQVPSRQDVIRRERVDEKSRQRNKRMFGALLGTLQKFRQEETKLKAKEDKKAEVEARVEEAKRREREELKRERQQLFSSRKRQLAEVRTLEAKLARSHQFQDWKASQLPLVNFIRTRTQPSIYYLPKINHPKTDALLVECSTKLIDEIERREKAVLQELELIESQFNHTKQQQSELNIDDTVNETVTSEEITITKEGEENRDPNPLDKLTEQLDMSIENNDSFLSLQNDSTIIDTENSSIINSNNINTDVINNDGVNDHNNIKYDDADVESNCINENTIINTIINLNENHG